MVTGKGEPPLGEAIQAYHLEQRARGVSPHTARAQVGDLGKLLDHALRARWESWRVSPRILRVHIDPTNQTCGGRVFFCPPLLTVDAIAWVSPELGTSPGASP